jgi:hypothetical protein
MHPISLPDGRRVGPRLIVETKDEHDWEPTGKEFGRFLREDVSLLGPESFVPRGAPGKVKFSMLRQAHFEVATNLFGSEDFDRLFVVHAIDPTVLADFAPTFAASRIYWLTLPELVRDLREWYRAHPRPAGLRHSLVGDLWHLLVGYCGLDFITVGKQK